MESLALNCLLTGEPAQAVPDNCLIKNETVGQFSSIGKLIKEHGDDRIQRGKTGAASSGEASLQFLNFYKRYSNERPGSLI